VTNLENNRKVVVRINDRGPFHGNRVLDLSTAAAEELGIAGGSEKVKITPLAMNDIVEDE
jgi:rare lipoprotein A